MSRERLAATPAKCPERRRFTLGQRFTALLEVHFVVEQPEFELGTKRGTTRREVVAEGAEMTFQIDGHGWSVVQHDRSGRLSTRLRVIREEGQRP